MSRKKIYHLLLALVLLSAWFITEVMAMMHGLGDVKKPLPESAAIVEELVHQQVSFIKLSHEIMPRQEWKLWAYLAGWHYLLFRNDFLFQMVSFVLQALEISHMRNPSAPSRLEPEDCLFLMRKNKVKLKRLYKWEMRLAFWRDKLKILLAILLIRKESPSRGHISAFRSQNF